MTAARRRLHGGMCVCVGFAPTVQGGRTVGEENRTTAVRVKTHTHDETSSSVNTTTTLRIRNDYIQQQQPGINRVCNRHDYVREVVA